MNVPRVRRATFLMLLLCGAASLGLRAADAPLTPAAADLCARKATEVNERGMHPGGARPRRTTFTEHEINSYLTLRAGPSLPQGLSKATIGIPGRGQITATALVDLDAVGKSRASGALLDPMNLLGGRVPVTITGTLRTENGSGTFSLQDAEVSGFPVPARLLQELVSYFTKTPGQPSGYAIDQPFALPYRIRTIEVGVGQAVVVQ